VSTDYAPDRALSYLLVDAVRLLRRDFRERSKGMRLTPALAKLLFYVHRSPGSRQADLAARLEVTAVTLGRMVDRLVERRYVKRVPDPVDRRALRVFVDRAGEPLVERMDKQSAATTARATRGLSSREQTEIIRQLRRICSNLSTQET
jgi:DNA-binding MarR family transcriptional regulator